MNAISGLQVGLPCYKIASWLLGSQEAFATEFSFTREALFLKDQRLLLGILSSENKIFQYER
jgi:hypothetical protein